MMLPEKVENLRAGRHSRSVVIDAGERACINCIWFEQYYRKNRGNVACMMPVSSGECILHDCRRGVLRQPCKDYETVKDVFHEGR